MKVSVRILLLCIVLGACDNQEPMEPLPDPKVQVQDISFEEGDDTRSVFIDFRLDKAAEETISISVQSQDGTAEAGDDFVAIDAVVLNFQPGSVVAPLRLDILGDKVAEDDESFDISITDIFGGEIARGTATVTLLNDDSDTLVIPEEGYTTPESYPGMTLIWRDEFEGAGLDETYWSHEIGTGCPNLCGWGNNELEYYRAENTSIKEGNLVIEAREESFGGRNYTSSRIITRDKLDFKYGRVDIRAVLPYGQGLWPALWMLGSNIGTVGWPACGEIDIMELIGGPNNDRTVHGTAHWSHGGDHALAGDAISLPSGIFNDKFHVFSIEWTASSIKWYMDDQLYYTLNTQPAELSELRENSYFFIFNVAVGGNWPGPPNDQTVFPQRMIVDYVRVFQEE